MKILSKIFERGKDSKKLRECLFEREKFPYPTGK
jgi:hypothetical protein